MSDEPGAAKGPEGAGWRSRFVRPERLHDEPDLVGFLRFLGFFVPIWWSWMIFTWYGTGFEEV